MTSDIVVLDRQRLNRKEYQFRKRDFSQSNLMSPSSCHQSIIGAQPDLIADKLQLSNLSNRIAAFSSYNTYSHRSFTMQAPEDRALAARVKQLLKSLIKKIDFQIREIDSTTTSAVSKA